MGSFSSCYLPVADISDDPTIQLRASVGDIAFQRLNYPNVLSGRCVKGAMYVKDGALHYRAVCGKMFCCECYKKNYQLSEIKGVEVLENHISTLASRGNQYRLFVIRSGLKISVEDGTTIIVKMQDAVEFAPRLMKICGLLKDEF